MRHLQFVFIFTLIIFSFFACSEKKAAVNELTASEKAEGWQLLFDGENTDQWHLYNNPKKPARWTVTNDGALYSDPSNIDAEPSDLLSNKVFTNFEFAFEWKLSDSGNSGIFLNVQERDTIPVAWATGPEYQLLDRMHHDYDKLDKRSGCLYGFGPQKNPVEPKAKGEWNQSRIKQVNGKVEFYLNGVLTAEQDFTTEEWKRKVAATGFKNFPEFGKNTSGHIALQDWAKGVWFRNLKIKEL